MNASFNRSGGGGGLSMGGNNKIYTEDIQNFAVRRALIELSGGQDFEFEVLTWRRWFVNSQVQEHVDARRDE